MKDWMLEVVLKKFGPSAIRGAVLGLSGWLMAKGNMLEPFGIVSDAVAKTTTIYWETLHTQLAIIVIPAVIAGFIKVAQREGEQVIKKVMPPKEETPQ